MRFLPLSLLYDTSSIFSHYFEISSIVESHPSAAIALSTFVLVSSSEYCKIVNRKRDNYHEARGAGYYRIKFIKYRIKSKKYTRGYLILFP